MLNKFTQAYIEAALWASSDNEGEPLDSNYGCTDLAPETLEKMKSDCDRFVEDNVEWLTEENLLLRSQWDHEDIGGHDFWLTRNRHSAGFWDGDWAEPAATKLTEASHSFGELALYVGDDGLVYIA